MALTCDGSVNSIAYTLPAGMDGTSLLTCCLWIRLRAGRVNNDPFIASGVVLPMLFSLSGDVADRVQFRNTGRSYTAGAVTQDVWDHWAFAYNGLAGSTNDQKLQMYKNGVLQALTHPVDQPSALPVTGSNLSLASASGGQRTPCDLAHVKLWLAALTAAEIAQEMQRAVPHRAANLILWTPLDDALSGTDYSQTTGGSINSVTQSPGPPIPWGGRHSMVLP